MEPNITSQATFYPFPKATHYSIKISTPFKLNSKSTKDILLVIDKSGSMAGTSLENTKSMVNLLLDHILGPSISSFSLITYNDTPKISFNMLNQKNPTEIKQIISNIKAEGGTVFTKALKSIEEIIRTFKHPPFLSIIFLTDGLVENSYDTSDDHKALKQAMLSLGFYIQKETKSCEIHALGVRSDHDPLFLSGLIKLGTSQGSYQYIKESSDTMDCFNNIIDILDGKGFDAFLNSDKELFTPFKINFMEVSEKLYEAEGFFEGEITIDPLSLTIGYDKNMTIPLKPEILKIQEKSHEIKYNLKYLQYKLTSISSQIISKMETKKLNDLETIAAEFKIFKDMVNANTQSCFRVHPADRPELLELSSTLQKSINTLEPLLNACFKSQVSNDLVAQVNAFAYKDIINSRLKKRLDKRAQTTVKIINDAYEAIKINVKSFDEKVLSEKYKEKIDAVGCCVLTALNFVEAILDGDCLCVSFHATRSEVCLVNPSQLIIDDIYPTLISANAFLDSVRYAFKIKPIDPVAGIENQGKKILKGAAAEDINACLPIYICEEHWKNASLLMKPVLGWVLTTDPLGYAYTQKMSIPHLLMGIVAVKHLQEPNSEFLQCLFGRLMETCLQIMRDNDDPGFGGTWKKEFRDLWFGYLKEAEVRCDNISRNEIFLTQLFCAKTIGWLEEKEMGDFEKIFEKICEEEMRRYQAKFEEKTANKRVLDILGIKSEIIQKIAEEFGQKEEEEKIEGNYDKKLIKIEDIVTKDFEKRDILKDIYKEYLTLFKKSCGKLFALKRLFTNEKALADFNSFKTLSIENDVQFLCLYLQNKTQHKNSDRKKALKFNIYRDFADKDQAIDFIETLASKIILEEISAIKYLKGFQKKKNELIFSQTKFGALKELTATFDIDRAVELFQSIGKSGRIFYFYWFKRYHPEMCAEKLRILMTGLHNEKVVMNEWVGGKFYPRNSIIKRIYKHSGKDKQIAEIFFGNR